MDDAPTYCRKLFVEVSFYDFPNNDQSGNPDVVGKIATTKNNIYEFKKQNSKKCLSSDPDFGEKWSFIWYDDVFKGDNGVVMAFIAYEEDGGLNAHDFIKKEKDHLVFSTNYPETTKIKYYHSKNGSVRITFTLTK